MDLSTRISISKARIRRHFVGELVIHVAGSKLLSFLFGAIAAAVVQHWLESDWRRFLEYIAAATCLLFAYRGTMLFGGRKLRAKTQLEARRVMRPDTEAEALLHAENLSRPIVGNAIELLTHPNLNTTMPLSKLGWAPTEVTFSMPPTAVRTFDNELRMVGGIDRSLTGANGAKLGLDREPFVSFDSYENPVFEFYLTDYRTQQSVFRAIESNPSLRSQLTSLDPARNRVPNAVGLQAIVLFGTGEVLCMRRHLDAKGEAGKLSISFEEAIKDTDFEVPGISPSEYLFRRAFVEEVLGCKQPTAAQVLSAWGECRSFVTTYRLWGLFFEERVAHFQLLGFYLLNISPGELVLRHRILETKGWASRDDEGRLLLLDPDQIDPLLKKMDAKVRGLYDGRPQSIDDIRQLHRTSLYRLWRLKIALDPRPTSGGWSWPR